MLFVNFILTTAKATCTYMWVSISSFAVELLLLIKKYCKWTTALYSTAKCLVLTHLQWREEHTTKRQRRPRRETTFWSLWKKHPTTLTNRPEADLDSPLRPVAGLVPHSSWRAARLANRNTTDTVRRVLLIFCWPSLTNSSRSRSTLNTDLTHCSDPCRHIQQWPRVLSWAFSMAVSPRDNGERGCSWDAALATKSKAHSPLHSHTTP